MAVEYSREIKTENVDSPTVDNQFTEEDVRSMKGEESEPDYQEPQAEVYEEPETESQGQEQEETQEVVEEKRRYRDPAKNRINQIQRQRYAALDEANRLREENERLRRLATISTETASKQFEDNVLQRLERAKNLKMQAYEAGDIKAQTDADLEMADAMADYKSHNTWKAQESLKSQENSYNSQVPIKQGPIVNEREARGWIERNSWANPNTSEFDRDLFQIADNAASQLDLYCYKNGQAHLIQSPQYFQELDNYMEQARQHMESQRQSHGRGQIPMKQPMRGGVTPVRASNNALGSSKQKMQLTQEQRDLAKSLGVTEDVYRQEVLRDMKDRPERYNRGGR